MSDPGQFVMRKFDPTTLKTDRTILIVGGRGSGKTTLLKDLMWHVRSRVDMAVGMTPTRDTVLDFCDMLPRHAVYREYDESRIKGILDFISNEQDANRDAGTIAIILDDCMFDPKIMRSKTMRELFMNGRHLKIMFFNLVQYVMDMPPPLRSNVDYVFAFYDPILANRERLYKQFFGRFERFQDMEDAYASLAGTHARACLVYDRTKGAVPLDQCMFWYEATYRKERFCVGSRDFWKLGHLAELGELAPPGATLQNPGGASAAAAQAAAMVAAAAQAVNANAKGKRGRVGERKRDERMRVLIEDHPAAKR